MKTAHERVCYACGFPAEPPFIIVHLKTGAPATHKGAEAVICVECHEKIQKDTRIQRRPDAPV